MLRMWSIYWCVYLSKIALGYYGTVVAIVPSDEYVNLMALYIIHFERLLTPQLLVQNSSIIIFPCCLIHTQYERTNCYINLRIDVACTLLCKILKYLQMYNK